MLAGVKARPEPGVELMERRPPSLTRPQETVRPTDIIIKGPGFQALLDGGAVKVLLEPGRDA
jgi:hypothetical protein